MKIALICLLALTFAIASAIDKKQDCLPISDDLQTCIDALATPTVETFCDCRGPLIDYYNRCTAGVGTTETCEGMFRAETTPTGGRDRCRSGRGEEKCLNENVDSFDGVAKSKYFDKRRVTSRTPCICGRLSSSTTFSVTSSSAWSLHTTEAAPMGAGGSVGSGLASSKVLLFEGLCMRHNPLRAKGVVKIYHIM